MKRKSMDKMLRRSEQKRKRMTVKVEVPLMFFAQQKDRTK
jgi:hypothetical protein